MCTLFFKDGTISNIHKEKNENKLSKNDILSHCDNDLSKIMYVKIYDTCTNIELVMGHFLIAQI